MKPAVVGVAVIATCAVSASQSQQSPAAKPYTARYQEVAIDRNGRERIASSHTIFMRSDGSRFFQLGSTGVCGEIADPRGLKFEVCGDRKSTTKISPLVRRATSSDCGLADDERRTVEREIRGYRGVGRQRGFSDRSNETFYALDYDCAVLESTLIFATGEKSVTSLVEFVPAEPDASLFETDRKTEVPPSQLSPGDLPQCLQSDGCRKMMERRDAAYHENRRRNGLGQ